MGIQRTGTPNLHWNYFIALEHDLEGLSRYVEFAPDNYETYSIELAHLLFAAASEVDVTAKLLCKQLDPRQSPGNIDGYKPMIMNGVPTIAAENVFVARYGLTLTPWEQWSKNDGRQPHPHWWSGYNKVKHQRDTHFKLATLQNALNAMGGLMLLAFHYYSYALAVPQSAKLAPKDATDLLTPTSTLLRLDNSAYRGHLLLE
jgi:hypothetical protein